jgi:hypothetical protein
MEAEGIVSLAGEGIRLQHTLVDYENQHCRSNQYQESLTGKSHILAADTDPDKTTS